jgi:hypothetical protein
MLSLHSSSASDSSSSSLLKAEKSASREESDPDSDGNESTSSSSVSWLNVDESVKAEAAREDGVVWPEAVGNDADMVGVSRVEDEERLKARNGVKVIHGNSASL